MVERSCLYAGSLASNLYKQFMNKFPEKIGYHWAPAAMEKLYYNCLVKKPSEQFMQKKETRKAGTRSYLVMEGLNTKLIYSSMLPLKGGWYAGRELLQQLSFGLYNAHNKSMKKSHYRLADELGKLVYRIQDSGGFQLFSGVQDFIDPKDLVRYHDRFADSGVGLDLPLSTIRDLSVLQGGARMLAANTEVMLKARKKPWQLMNVSHGLTPPLRAAWQKIALAEPGDSLCIAGLRGSIDKKAVGANPTAVAAHLLVGMLHPNDYKHYHLLGLSSISGMILAALISNLHQKVVTSDSTTYLNGQQFGNFGYNPIEPATEHNYRRLECSCAVCAFVEYEYWMKDNAYFMSIHNAYRISHICETVNGMMRHAIESKMKPSQIMRMIMAAKIGLGTRYSASMLAAVDLILNTTKYEDACKINVSYTTPIIGSLFRPAPEKAEDLTRQIKIIKTYEKYHNKRFLK